MLVHKLNQFCAVCGISKENGAFHVQSAVSCLVYAKTISCDYIRFLPALLDCLVRCRSAEENVSERPIFFLLQLDKRAKPLQGEEGGIVK